MRHRIFPSLLSLSLALGLCVLPAAALETDDLKTLLQTYYVDQVPENVLDQDTVQAVLDALNDPYTTYMTAEEYQSFLNQVDGETVVGIGVSIQTTVNDGVQILSVLEGSPAQKAGLSAGDRILSVDGVTLEPGMDPSSLIRGEAGSRTTLTVRLHSTGKTRDFTLERRAVVIPIVTYELKDGDVGYIKCDSFGASTAATVQEALEELEAALRPDTVLVSMMLVNNELGTVLPVAQAARLVRRLGSSALIHCDGVQGFLKIPFTPAELGVDLLTVSGHKIHAPKGIGALYIRRGLKLPPLIRGGGQEEGLRSGTEATAQIAAFAAAVRAGAATREADIRYMAGLKAETLARLQEAVPGLKPIGSGTAPHILAVTLPGYKSEVIVRFLSDRGICLSSGSACHKGKPSHVYAALKLPKSDLDGALRISFSYDTTQQDVDALADGLRAAKGQLFPTLS